MSRHRRHNRYDDLDDDSLYIDPGDEGFDPTKLTTKQYIKWLNSPKSMPRIPRRKARTKKRHKAKEQESFMEILKRGGSKKHYKRLASGRINPQFTPYTYNHKRNKRLQPKPGDRVPENQSTPVTHKGYQWKNVTGQTTRKVQDYENSDIFSDFDGNFFLQKIGNTYKCWINVESAEVYDSTGKPVKKVNDSQPICVNKWTDPTGSKGFQLARIAAYFAKHNIYEDTTEFPHVYNDVNMGCGGYKYWNIFNGGVRDSKPHAIARAGETIIIDTGRMKVYKTDGTDLTRYTSFGTSFPPLYGGKINWINFHPTVGEGCEVTVTYVPRIK